MQVPGDLTPFVGRAYELDWLQAAFDAATGRGGVVLLAGEPGIGKTTTCRRFAATVSGQGGLALLGQCDDAGELSVPYLPFVEIVHAAALAREPDELVRDLGTSAADLARLVPLIRERLLDLPPAEPPGDPIDARYRLLQGVTGFLRSVAAAVPLLLVLEDLQDADHGTLDVLGHLSRHLGDARILIVGTYRSTEVDREHPLAQTIATVRRRVDVQRLTLDGLSSGEVRELVDRIAGQRVSHRLAESVYTQTEGNPLFVWEVMRQRLQSQDSRRGTPLLHVPDVSWTLDAVPDGLGETIGTRLARLSTPCQRVLAVAAVVGREPTLQTIEAVADEPPETVGPALAEAVRASVLREQVRVGGVTYRFAHALFRQTLYAELAAVERLRLHPRVARALEEQHGADDEHAGELAEHFAHSRDPDDLRKALAYSRRAADHATRVYASAEAARLLGHALTLQEAVAPDDLALRCDLLTAQGQALLDAGAARHALDEIATPAFALAEGLNDPIRASTVCALAMACFQNEGSSYALAGPESASWASLADRWAQPGTVARVWADAFLGVQSYFRERWFDGLPLLRRALDGARALDDLETLWWMRWLWVGYANTPQDAADQLRVAEEIAALPRSGVSARTLAYALSWTAATFLAQGERTRADAIWRELVDLAVRSGQPSVQVQAFRGPATMATLDGRLEEAAAIAEQSIEYSAEAGLPHHGRISASLIGLRPILLLGRHDDAVRLVEPGTAPLKTVTMAHLGRHAEARAYLDEGVMARSDFGTDQDVTHQYMDVFRLEAAVLVGHRPAAARLLNRLAPLSHVTTGVRMPTCVSRHLGAAAAMLGRPVEALAHLRAALDLARALPFRPEIALTRLEFADLLTASFPNRRAEAAEHLANALSEFGEMGMAPALARAEALADRLKFDAPTGAAARES